MFYFRVNQNCNGCLSCVENCPASALSVINRNGQRTLRHNMSKCARCSQCWRICPERAIEFQHLLDGGWDDVITFDLIHCRGCGDCVLSFTGGICPVTRCAKGLFHGPCGGSKNGSCEISPDISCAWELIFYRLKRQNKLHLLREVRPPERLEAPRGGRTAEAGADRLGRGMFIEAQWK